MNTNIDIPIEIWRKDKSDSCTCCDSWSITGRSIGLVWAKRDVQQKPLEDKSYLHIWIAGMNDVEW